MRDLLKLYGHVKEKHWQGQVRKIATEYGWQVFVTYDSRKCPPGEPDLRLIRPPRVVFIELKTMRGRLSDAQEAAGEMFKACPGVEYYLLRPSDVDLVHEILRF